MNQKYLSCLFLFFATIMGCSGAIKHDASAERAVHVGDRLVVKNVQQYEREQAWGLSIGIELIRQCRKYGDLQKAKAANQPKAKSSAVQTPPPFDCGLNLSAKRTFKTRVSAGSLSATYTFNSGLTRFLPMEKLWTCQQVFDADLSPSASLTLTFPGQAQPHRAALNPEYVQSCHLEILREQAHKKTPGLRSQLKNATPAIQQAMDKHMYRQCSVTKSIDDCYWYVNECARCSHKAEAKAIVFGVRTKNLDQYAKAQLRNGRKASWQNLVGYLHRCKNVPSCRLRKKVVIRLAQLIQPKRPKVVDHWLDEVDGYQAKVSHLHSECGIENYCDKAVLSALDKAQKRVTSFQKKMSAWAEKTALKVHRRLKLKLTMTNNSRSYTYTKPGTSRAVKSWLTGKYSHTEHTPAQKMSSSNYWAVATITINNPSRFKISYLPVISCKSPSYKKFAVHTRNVGPKSKRTSKETYSKTSTNACKIKQYSIRVPLLEVKVNNDRSTSIDDRRNRRRRSR